MIRVRFEDGGRGRERESVAGTQQRRGVWRNKEHEHGRTWNRSRFPHVVGSALIFDSVTENHHHDHDDDDDDDNDDHDDHHHNTTPAQVTQPDQRKEKIKRRGTYRGQRTRRGAASTSNEHFADALCTLVDSPALGPVSVSYITSGAAVAMTRGSSLPGGYRGTLYSV
jgi:hypothetical protein